MRANVIEETREQAVLRARNTVASLCHGYVLPNLDDRWGRYGNVNSFVRFENSALASICQILGRINGMFLSGSPVAQENAYLLYRSFVERHLDVMGQPGSMIDSGSSYHEKVASTLIRLTDDGGMGFGVMWFSFVPNNEVPRDIPGHWHNDSVNAFAPLYYRPWMYGGLIFHGNGLDFSQPIPEGSVLWSVHT